MSGRARFLLSVNDGNNGLPTGHIDGVDVMGEEGDVLELRACVWPPSRCPRFTRGDGWVRISRRKFPILGYKEWVGNWCWDAVSMGAADGAELLNYLRELGWHCEGGISPYFEQWESGGKWRPSDVGAMCMTAAELAKRKAARAVQEQSR